MEAASGARQLVARRPMALAAQLLAWPPAPPAQLLAWPPAPPPWARHLAGVAPHWRATEVAAQLPAWPPDAHDWPAPPALECLSAAELPSPGHNDHKCGDRMERPRTLVGRRRPCKSGMRRLGQRRTPG